jgi:hypothetical protein
MPAMSRHAAPPVLGSSEPPERWRALAVLSGAILLAMAPWFSASAVGPALSAEWRLAGMDLALLTIAVQVGFACGALLLAATGAADVLPARVLIAAGATTAATANAGFVVAASDLQRRSRSGSPPASRSPPSIRWGCGCSSAGSGASAGSRSVCSSAR